MNLGFLASHRGSNMQAVVAACRAGALAANPVVLICNNRSAEALARAEAQGVTAVVLNAATHPDPDMLDSAMLEILQRHGCDVIVLAGFMKKIGPRVLAAYADRIINIHPSLLPKHGGRGMYGRAVHEAVLTAGDHVTGVTVHLVNAEYDEGRILAQGEVPVRPGDTVDALAARVLAQEHAFLVGTLQRIADGRLKIG
ncbi:MAG: phosphoribosylglycinamide formyltransferase [Opitutaceae bacterium]|nr:phosphoribosylglycinamide formyltransferase [Opitutaceae bacterium]